MLGKLRLRCCHYAGVNDNEGSASAAVSSAAADAGGCGWEGEYSELKTHLQRSCPLACPCPNMPAASVSLAATLRTDDDPVCEWRGPFSTAEAHMRDECALTPEPCTLGSECSALVRRCFLDQHMASADDCAARRALDARTLAAQAAAIEEAAKRRDAEAYQRRMALVDLVAPHRKDCIRVDVRGEWQTTVPAAVLSKGRAAGSLLPQLVEMRAEKDDSSDAAAAPRVLFLNANVAAFRRVLEWLSGGSVPEQDSVERSADGPEGWALLTDLVARLECDMFSSSDSATADGTRGFATGGAHIVTVAGVGDANGERRLSAAAPQRRKRQRSVAGGGAKITQAQLLQYMQVSRDGRLGLPGADLSGLYMGGASMQGSNFQGANLRRANFVGADLREVNFEGSDASGADFADANMAGAKLTGAQLTECQFEKCHFFEFLNFSTMCSGPISQFRAYRGVA
jgi:hypothetical protein